MNHVMAYYCHICERTKKCFARRCLLTIHAMNKALCLRVLHRGLDTTMLVFAKMPNER